MIHFLQLENNITNQSLVQKILEQAPRYSMNVAGQLPGPEEGKATFEAIPPEFDYSSKFLMAIYQDEQAIGVLDLLIGYPNQEKAFIGLLLLIEKVQRKGLGSEVYLEVEKFIKTFIQIKTIRLSVVESNGDVMKFWSKMGFHKTGEEKPFLNEKVTSKSILMEKSLPSFSIRLANKIEGDLLTDLALRSKSYWKYSEDYLLKCRPALLVDEDYISSWPVFVLMINGVVAGFTSLKTIKGENRLDNLWIDLPYIGKGYGKMLLFHAIEEAKKLGWDEFYLAADPGAQSFYEKFGAVKVGMVQSRIKSDLFLPHMRIKITNSYF